MSYTVKNLAKLSGVSIRTLHWYDEIGLLKPAYYGANGYRYYEEEQLLILQQVLFFRKLGFHLKDIQKVLMSSEFDKIKALCAHRTLLEEKANRFKELIETVDKTIMHLKGKHQMKDKEFYTGFDPVKQEEYEQYLVKYHGKVAEDLILESKKNTKDWDKNDWKRVEQEGNAIYKGRGDCINKGLGPRDNEVQDLISKHFQMMERFYTTSKDVYMGLAELYCEHPDFKKWFEKHHHPKLVEFIAEAMRVYAHRNLS